MSPWSEWSPTDPRSKHYPKDVVDESFGENKTSYDVTYYEYPAGYNATSGFPEKMGNYSNNNNATLMYDYGYEYDDDYYDQQATLPPVVTNCICTNASGEVELQFRQRHISREGTIGGTACSSSFETRQCDCKNGILWLRCFSLFGV